MSLSKSRFLFAGLILPVFLAAVCPVWTSAQTMAPSTPPHDFMVNNTPLTDKALVSAFSGITHDGFYRYEQKETVPQRFVETTSEAGAVKHVQGEETMTGTWDVKGDRICYTYDYNKLRPLCYDIYRVGNCYYHVLMTSGSQRRGVWTAQSSPKGERPSCEPHVS
ncbi:MAG: hypothetical protein ACSHXY_09550 [Alphaproteobacteria bacterium]